MAETSAGPRVLGDTRYERHIELAYALESMHDDLFRTHQLSAVLAADGSVKLLQVSVFYNEPRIATLALSPSQFADLVAAVTAYRAQVEARGDVPDAADDLDDYPW
jgi:hypothetical protein